jgi:hypothetical protein
MWKEVGKMKRNHPAKKKPGKKLLQNIASGNLT